ncbi:MAG: acyl-CoA dehydrogenase family protein [Alphaproteobacteria bacterium]|nr:acyl-CoA dehydrogenase family protein [Alphaproteobacteria bacterium]
MIPNLYFDFNHPEEVEGYVKGARTIVETEIGSRVKAAEAKAEFPQDLWPILGKAGILGINAPEEYEGLEAGCLTHTRIIEEISSVSPGIGLSVGAHTALALNRIQEFGTADQKHKYLPGLINGTQVGALATTEPNAGSNALGIRLRAEKKSDRYILNGSKIFITNGVEANTYVVYAVTNPEAGNRGKTAFIVEKNFKGFKAGPKMDKAGMKSSNTAELFFDNCEVPAENILGGEGRGANILMDGFNYERVVLAGGPLGIMRRAIDQSLSYAVERKQFGKDIAQFQLVQQHLSEMYTQYTAMQSYVYEVAKGCDRGRLTNRDAAGCLMQSARAALDVADRNVQILGGYGYMAETGAIALSNDAKLYTIGAGTDEIRQLIVGREMRQIGLDSQRRPSL